MDGGDAGVRAWDARRDYVAVKAAGGPRAGAAMARAPGRGPERGCCARSTPNATASRRHRRGRDEAGPRAVLARTARVPGRGMEPCGRRGWTAQWTAGVAVTITGRGVGRIRSGCPGRRPAAAVRGPQADPGQAGGTTQSGGSHRPSVSRRVAAFRAGRVQLEGMPGSGHHASRTDACSGRGATGGGCGARSGGARSGSRIGSPGRPRAPRTTS